MTSNDNLSQFSTNAIELIQELRDNPDVIPPYNHLLIDKCSKQIMNLYNENLKALVRMSSMENGDKELMMVNCRQATIDHIKRCCCSYLSERLDRLKHSRWKSGGHLPQSVKANLSEAELKWSNSYNEIIFDFQNQFDQGDYVGINLLNHVDPPEKLLVRVRALKDNGQFETSDGTSVILNKGTIHLLPRQDCENLVRTGVLEYMG